MPAQCVAVCFRLLSIGCHVEPPFVGVCPQPYWHLVDSSIVSFLTSRGTCLAKLDLSWCGNYGALTDADFCK